MTNTFPTSLGDVAYDIQGSGPTLVLLPSGAHDRHDFDELRHHLDGRLRTIAMDWPSHGESAPASGPATAVRMADAAEEFVAHIAGEGAIVLGNSIGGFAAARMAVRRPELVDGLVFVDGGGFLPLSPQVRLFCSLMSRPRFLRTIYPTFSARYMRARTDADRRAREAAIATTRANPGLRSISELWGSFASPEHDLRADAASITAPTLVVWGRKDPVIPLRVGRRVAEQIPDARLEVFDSGHVPFTTEPQRFAELLVEFAAQVGEPAMESVR
ncbi:MAG TPA: alpha/beta hydrolase [Solirubrobacteraceae bacterium]|jgi:pimeloyl-ACP methyl ester carboxylesterase